jgi:hypothetical protein
LKIQNRITGYFGIQKNSFLFFSFIIYLFKDLVRYIFQLYPKKINIQNDEHRTPLHLAASLGDIEMCKILIECGARVNSFIQTSSVSYRFFTFINRLLNRASRLLV